MAISADNITVSTLSAGDVVYIKWNINNGGGFDWDLVEVPLTAGDNCSLAVTATSGTNSLQATINSNYWYTYTIQNNDNKLVISSTSFESLEVYTNTCANLGWQGNGFESLTIASLSAGDVVYIKWYTTNGGGFDWDLSEVPLAAGDNCSLAVTATLGNNTTPSAPNWFTFTVPSSGNYTISSVGTATNDTYLRVYSDCAGTLIDQNDDFGSLQSKLTLPLTDADVIYILWDNTYSSSGFDWSLTELIPEAGDNCTVAEMASLGNNTTPSAPYWFTYTVPSSGYYTISSVGTATNDTYLRVYSDCSGTLIDQIDDFDFSGGIRQSELNLPLTVGEVIYILWDNTWSSSGFDWSLTEAEDGDICALPVTATAGTNSLPATTNTYYWYTYTMQNNDNKLTITSTSLEYVYVYTNTCASLSYQGGEYENITVTSLSAGDLVYIKWESDNGGGFEWDLSEAPFAAGDICSLAVTGVLGTNSLPATINTYYWYTYTMQNDNLKLAITSTSSEVVTVYTNTCASLSYQGGNYENITVNSLSTGDLVYIKWESDNGGGFDWDLLELPLAAGDICSLAATATLGSNTTPSAPYWYTYTALSSGDYTISSVGTATNDTYLRVYSDCAGTLIDQNDDFDFSGGIRQSELNLPLTVGEVIYILWDDTWSSGGFDWSMNDVNDAPSFTIGANQSVDEDAGVQTVTSWATAISDGDNDSQSLVFNVNSDNNGLFSTQSAISISGDLTYTPAANANGMATVTISLSDDGGTANGGVDNSGDQTFTITINPVNDAPIITAYNGITTVDEDNSLTLDMAQLTVIDVDNVFPSDFTMIVQAGSNYSVTGNIITPDNNFNGSLTVPVIVNDGNEDSSPFDITVIVNAINDLPVATGNVPNQLIDPDEAFSLVLTTGIFEDIEDGENGMVFSATMENGDDLPTWLSFDSTLKTFSGTPQNADAGTITISIKATDSEGASAQLSFTITVNIVTGLADDISITLRLYPNPVRDQMSIDFENTINGDVRLTLYDLNGKVLFYESYQQSDKKNYIIDLSSIQPGLYQLHITNNKNTVVKSIIKNQ